MTTTLERPKAFVSYSWTSPQHEDFVIGLAERLVSDGVEVILDKWDLKEGHDKYVFMEQMVTDPDVAKVIIVSDKNYAEKADARKGGVGTESQIISAEVYSKAKQEKFVPVVVEFKEDGEPWLPSFLKTRIYINLSSPDVFYAEYEKLIRNIYDRPLRAKPQIGKPHTCLLEEAPRAGTSSHAFSAFKDAVLAGKSNARTLGTTFLERVLDGMEELRFEASEDVDERVVDGIARLKPYRDQFCEYLRLVVDSSLAEDSFQRIHSFLERALLYNYPTEGMRSYNELWFDHYRFFNMELFLYLSATLIRAGKYNLLDMFLSEGYYLNREYRRKLRDFSVFNEYIRGLDEYRNQRLELNRISLTADLLHDRADVKGLSFESIMQSDFVLCLRSVLHSDASKSRWFPRTLIYRERFDNEPFELFVRATEERHFEILKTLLKVISKADLVDKLKNAYKVHDLDRWALDHYKIPFVKYMNLDGLYAD